jgi:hypothetical protein
VKKKNITTASSKLQILVLIFGRHLKAHAVAVRGDETATDNAMAADKH